MLMLFRLRRICEALGYKYDTRIQEVADAMKAMYDLHHPVQASICKFHWANSRDVKFIGPFTAEFNDPCLLPSAFLTNDPTQNFPTLEEENQWMSNSLPP